MHIPRSAFPFPFSVFSAVVFIPMIFVISGVVLLRFPSCPLESAHHMQRLVFGISAFVCSSVCQCMFRISCLYPLCGAYEVTIVIGMDFWSDFSVILSMR